MPRLAVLVAVDITQRKQAEAALSRLQDQLARSTRASALAVSSASIAHEINQPLAAVAANAQALVRWLQAHPPEVEEARNAGERIVRDVRRASAIVGRIRAMLRQEAGQREPIDLLDVLSTVLDRVVDSARALGVDLIWRGCDSDIRVVVDRVQIEQLVLNLLVNALEAMPAETDRPRKIDVWVQRHEAAAVAVAVRDTGTGIAPECRAHVFEPFHSTKAQGMGLGLALCRSIVESHGGRLWAEANPSGGETFWFTLPVASESLTKRVEDESQ